MPDILITEEDKEQLDAALVRERARVAENRFEMSAAHSTAGDGWHDGGFIAGIAPEMAQILRLQSLEETARDCVVVPTVEQNYEVGLGNAVMFKDKDGEHMVLLVGLAIGNRGMEVVSARSPLGQVLIGKHYGDVLEMPDGSQSKVLDILSPSEVVAHLSSKG